jgi:hypothetical protein
LLGRRHSASAPELWPGTHTRNGANHEVNSPGWCSEITE